MLYGCEAHVCIKQTAHDLLEDGYGVTVVTDGTSSINHYDRNCAIHHLMNAGVQVTTFQSLVFELMRDAKHPNFKQILKIVMDNPKDADGKDIFIDLMYLPKM